MNEKAKQKAKELIEKFKYSGGQMKVWPLTAEEAKQCALICVEEIIKEGRIDKIQFWQNVKQEILDYEL